MEITLIEPFFTGSHARWAREWKQYSRHKIKILSLPGRFWKWRMHGAAITLAKSFLEQDSDCDLLVCSDMLDVSLFMSLTRRRTHDIPVALYMHENQLTYPWSEEDEDPRQQRDQHYAFINYSSALTADAVFFNSNYHRESYLSALHSFVRQYPDYQNKATVEKINQKSSVLYPGITYDEFSQKGDRSGNGSPVLVWNHRWEYDKQPEVFFNLLFDLDDEGLDFQLIVLGESADHYPNIFDRARKRLQSRILHFGYAETPPQYCTWLQMGDILPVTSAQDFFGLSVVEAIAAGLIPLLPCRLAYPEHIPAEAQGVLLYESEEIMRDRLREWIIDWPIIRDKWQIGENMQRYDWSVLTDQYDESMEQLG